VNKISSLPVSETAVLDFVFNLWFYLAGWFFDKRKVSKKATVKKSET